MKQKVPLKFAVKYNVYRPTVTRVVYEVTGLPTKTLRSGRQRENGSAAKS